MFETLQNRLGGVFSKLTRRGALSSGDIESAMRELRRALIEADVALEVVRGFIARASERATGQEVIRSVAPGQQVVKIVYDTLVEILGPESESLDLKATPPVPVMLVGLQGSGKTTTAAKIALRLKTRERKSVLLASLDTRRPAAHEQLRLLGKQAGVAVLPFAGGLEPPAIARRAMDEANRGGHDVVILDTAGRSQADAALMAEAVSVRDAVRPHETLLVADALTGQNAVQLARGFDEHVGLTGIVLTRADGDGRGGAALSMRAVTARPIKLIGVGEKLDALEAFHPERIAGRILGQGDVVSLVEKAAREVDEQKAKKLAQRLQKGRFDLNDLAEQLRQMQKLGGMSGLIGALPGVGKLKKQLDGANIDDKAVGRQLAIVSSMTSHERSTPKIMNASRRKRVAQGSGTRVQDVNQLLRMHRQMSDMMKKIGRGKGGLMSGLLGGGLKLPGMGATPSPSPAAPAGFPKLPLATRVPPSNPGPTGGLPGLGGGLPGLGALLKQSSHGSLSPPKGKKN